MSVTHFYGRTFVSAGIVEGVRIYKKSLEVHRFDTGKERDFWVYASTRALTARRANG